MLLHGLIMSENDGDLEVCFSLQVTLKSSTIGVLSGYSRNEFGLVEM